MSLKIKNTISDIAAFGLSQVIIRLRGLIILPLFAHKMGIEDYGVFTQISLTIALMIPLVSLRLETASVRFLSSEKNTRIFREKFYTAFLTIVILSSIVGLLININSVYITKFILGDITYSNLIVVGSLLLISSSVNSYLLGYFRIVQRVNIYSILLLGESFLETIGLFSVIYSGNNLVEAFWILVVVKLSFSATMFSFIFLQLGFPVFRVKDAKAMISYGVPLIPNAGMRWMINYADRICIAQFIGLTAVGAYSASYSFGMLINLISMPVGFVLFPLLSRMWDEGKKTQTCKFFRYFTHYHLLFSLPFCVFISYISQPLLNFLVGPDFNADSKLVFLIAIGFVMDGLYQINAYAFHLAKKTSYMTWILIVSVLTNIGLNLLLIPNIDLYGAAVSTMITFFLMTLFTVILGQKMIGYSICFLNIIKIIVSNVIMTSLLIILPSNKLVFILCNIFFCILIYMSLLYILKVFTNKDIILLKSLMQ